MFSLESEVYSTKKIIVFLRMLFLCCFHLQIMFLSSLGGSDMGDAIRRMLRKIGTNKLWSGYNLKGRKEEFRGAKNM